MSSIDICQLGTSRVDPKTNVVKSQTSRGPEGEETFGELPHYQALGLTAVPWPPDDTGAAEGVVAEGAGGLPGVILGGRDSRTNAIVGNAKQGDTILHTTGPEQSAQLQLKEKKRQAVLATKDSKQKQIVLSLDGKADSVTIAAFGYIVQIQRDSGINLCSKNGKNGISITDDCVHIRGNVVLGGMVAIPAMAPMMGPVTGSPGGPASVPLIAAKGVTFGQ
jgi:hypothetical protein